MTNIPHRCRLGADISFIQKLFGGGVIQIQEETIKAAYKQVELMLSDAVNSAKSEDEFKNNLGRLQLVGQRLLAIMIFNSCAATNQSIYDVLELVGQGIKKELDQITAAAKAGPEHLTSVETLIPKSEPKEH